MSELHDRVDYDNLNFDQVGPIKDVIFYEYMDSKVIFNKIKKNQIKFSEVKNKQKNFLKKLNETTMGKKNLMLITMQNKMKLKEQDLKY